MFLFSIREQRRIGNDRAQRHEKQIQSQQSTCLKASASAPSQNHCAAWQATWVLGDGPANSPDPELRDFRASEMHEGGAVSAQLSLSLLTSQTLSLAQRSIFSDQCSNIDQRTSDEWSALPQWPQVRQDSTTQVALDQIKKFSTKVQGEGGGACALCTD